ncbi:MULTISPECIES: RNA polymerase sigma factor [Olivibacter]|jgi:RNA polymerase sigma factor (sigma-70 family)|uniref:RNA polymerase, sigma-24 subunit, ECF subfamily n=2 Tax=Sphingobacteriaceae TaxID=84566 RepID=F4CA57_SPHS2|nr:sigma-70 family RNA polymerase sigma factor [Olivibacter sp. 47]MCL4642117.1 sigma-70 family RNA polymerase sigma factor [Olivibacter sp. UJ_SKK_5.1]MDM8176647.1 sigma-70 family RNA polymerase sigma factor [Olivibacter sp. 47]MDX3912789.1 sigma-70 family RNA polymerase sigma factor [Pseudosphingobacterium sp.]
MREQSAWDDRSMWDGLVDGQQGAFTALVRRYTDTLYDYGMRLCTDEELVKDCVQEVFLFIWRRRQYLQQPVSLKFYLMKAVRNKIGRELPKWQMKEQLQESEYQFPDFFIELDEQTATPPAVRKRLKSYIDQLSPRQREILYLRFYEGLRQQKIAEMMNLNHQSVYNLLRGALVALKKKVDYETLIAYWCFFFVLLFFS